MEATRKFSFAPAQVKIALALWALGAALNFGTWAFQTDWHDAAMYLAAAGLVSLSLLLLWFLSRGHNWARWLAVVLIGFRVLAAGGALHRADEVSAYQLLSVGFRAGCQVVAVVLLFSTAGTAWFRGGRQGGTSTQTSV
jgi:hypothetical protein